MISKFPNGENAWNWVVNMVFKFHDDPTVNESEIVIFLRQVWWPVGKREGFERRTEKKWNWEAKEAEESVWPCILLFIARGIHDLSFTLFIYFYYFIKNRNSILFSIKWIIKYPFYLFIYKISLFSKILFTKKMGCYMQCESDILEIIKLRLYACFVFWIKTIAFLLCLLLKAPLLSLNHWFSLSC